MSPTKDIDDEFAHAARYVGSLLERPLGGNFKFDPNYYVERAMQLYADTCRKEEEEEAEDEDVDQQLDAELRMYSAAAADSSRQSVGGGRRGVRPLVGR